MDYLSRNQQKWLYLEQGASGKQQHQKQHPRKQVAEPFLAF
jgi:hypothetical protein